MPRPMIAPTVFSTQLATGKLIVVLSSGKQPLIMSTIIPDAQVQGFVGKEAGIAHKFVPAARRFLKKIALPFIALIGKETRGVC
jgi:hypothetical protein